MVGRITAAEVRRAWRRGEEIALLDVREEGPYSEAHPFWAVCLPFGRLQLRILDLVPRLAVPVVVYDAGEGLAPRAAAAAEALGYGDVRVLDGGLGAYAREGEVFRDVNVPSKAFGELVESIRHTPSLSAAELQARLSAGADVAVLDARRFEEYRTMSIPSGVSVPGGELVLRVFDAVPSPETLVVVNCAGRTRSIIGAQSLVNAGIPNPVVALRNGTIGWTLAGLPLARGAGDRFPALTPEARERACRAAAAWAAHVGVAVIGRAMLSRWQAESGRTLYRFDVRTPEEYVAGHPEGFLSAPGGQLVQATDEWVAVRGARIVLFDDDGVRARMAASWLVQMGWDAAVLEVGELPADRTGPSPCRRPPLPAAGDALISAEELARLAGAATVVDLSPSPVYRHGHIPGACFVLPSRIDADLPALRGSGPLVLTSADGAVALLSLAAAREATRRPVRVLAGGTQAWRAAGGALESDRHDWRSPAIDVYKRPYEGTDNAAAAMQAYIDWELQLVAQLANDGVSGFRVVRQPG